MDTAAKKPPQNVHRYGAGGRAWTRRRGGLGVPFVHQCCPAPWVFDVKCVTHLNGEGRTDAYRTMQLEDLRARDTDLFKTKMEA